MNFKTANQLESTSDSNPWLIDRLLIARGITLVAGLPKVHKSWLLSDMTVSVASGGASLGLYQTHSCGNVLMIQGEDSEQIIGERLNSICKGRKVDPSTLGRITVLTDPTFRIDNEEHFAALEEQVQRMKPKLVTIDPLARLIDCPDTSRPAMKRVLSKLRAFQTKHDLCLIICTHLSKNSKGDLSSIAGSGDLRSCYDQAIIMTKPAPSVTRCIFDFKALPEQPEVFFHLRTVDGNTAPMTLIQNQGAA